MYTGLEIYAGDANNMTANIDNAFAKVTAAGNTYTRLVLVWRDASPSPGSSTVPVPLSQLDDPSTYTWGNFDTYVAKAVANGLKPLITVWRAPDWAEDRHPGDNPNWRSGTIRPKADMFGAFATAAALHFKALYPTTQFAWEVWNEPNGTYFLRPQKENGVWVFPGIYRPLMNAFYDGIQTADAAAGGPSSIVVAGSTAPFGNNFRPGAFLFMRKVLCLSSTLKPVAGCGSGVKADAWSTHPYTSGGPTHRAYSSNDASLGDLPRMHKALVSAIRSSHLKTNHGPVRFWVSEFGWDSKGPDPGGVPLSVHARWTSEALYRAWRAGVSVFIFHQLRDRPIPGAAYQAGLYFCGARALTDDPSCENNSFSFNSDVAKPALRAATFPFVAFAASGRITVWGRTPNSVGGETIYIERKTSSGYRRMFTMTSNSYGIFTKRFSSSLTRGVFRARIVTGSPKIPSLGFSLVRPPDRKVNPFGSYLG